MVTHGGIGFCDMFLFLFFLGEVIFSVGIREKVEVLPFWFALHGIYIMRELL